MTLSSEAQAVLDAVVSHPEFATRKRIASALRAVVAETQQRQYNDCYICGSRDILAIATELEAQ